MLQVGARSWRGTLHHARSGRWLLVAPRVCLCRVGDSVCAAPRVRGCATVLPERRPGVRTVEGSSGIGSQDTKLQVAVRGVNPRLSSRATVLLDEIPLAPAPYGQPQMSLFPLSVFSIDTIDVVRGGATARYGPQTSGGGK